MHETCFIGALVLCVMCLVAGYLIGFSAGVECPLDVEEVTADL